MDSYFEEARLYFLIRFSCKSLASLADFLMILIFSLAGNSKKSIFGVIFLDLKIFFSIR